jgi:hypothetical protein
MKNYASLIAFINDVIASKVNFKITETIQDERNQRKPTISLFVD